MRRTQDPFSVMAGLSGSLFLAALIASVQSAGFLPWLSQSSPWAIILGASLITFFYSFGRVK